MPIRPGYVSYWYAASNSCGVVYSRWHGSWVQAFMFEKSDGRRYVAYKNGYVVPYARLIAEIGAGRTLDRDEETHHVDGDRTNDRLVNLAVVPSQAHTEYHRALHKGKTPPPEVLAAFRFAREVAA